jgi:hypothetical protein
MPLTWERVAVDLRFSARRMAEFLELEERLVGLRMVSLAQTFTRAAWPAGQDRSRTRQISVGRGDRAKHNSIK